MPDPDRARRWRVIAAFAVVSVVWGSTYFAIRIALGTFAPFVLGTLRFTIAGGLFYAFLRLKGVAAPTPRQWGAAAITGTLFFVVSNGLVNVAERSVSSGLASIVVATMPLWATLFARMLGERASASEWVAIALGLVGVVVLNAGVELRAGGAGAVAAIVAPMAWSLGTVVSRRLPLPAGAMCVAAQMVVGGVGTAIVSVAAHEPMPSSVGWGAVGAVLYLVVFGSLVGFSAYTYLLRNTRAVVATSYAYVNPVIAIALGVAFLGERLDAASALGAAIILAAVLLVTRSKAARAAPKVAPVDERPLDESPLNESPLNESPLNETKSDFT